MKILMLTAKCGMGHFKCAKAIEEKIKNDFKLADVECLDIYEAKFGQKAGFFYKLYDFLVDYGNVVYNFAYKKIFKKNDKQLVVKIFSDMLQKDFHNFIEERKPDLVISTYSFTSELMSSYKEKTGSKIPLITWITDVSPHKGWVNYNTDAYIIADEITKKELEKMGVASDKIQIGGIPVSKDFDKKFLKEKSEKKHILIMGGGLGILPKNLSFYKRLNDLKDVEITIVTGKNKNLYYKLLGRFPNLHILGYVNNINDLMKNSDLLLTKAGGITTFEAIHTETPLIVFKPFLEQEVHNANYISDKEIGFVLPSKMKQSQKDLAIIVEILENDELLENMKYNIRKIKDGIDPSVLQKVLSKESDKKCS